MDAIRNRACEGRDSFVRLNAGMVETAVVQHIRSLLRTPEIAARAMEAARRTDPDMTEHDVVTALAGFDGLWDSLFPAAPGIGRASCRDREWQYEWHALVAV